MRVAGPRRLRLRVVRAEDFERAGVARCAGGGLVGVGGGGERGEGRFGGWWSGRREGEGKGGDGPCVRDDDVVEGRVFLAEAGEAYP